MRRPVSAAVLAAIQSDCQYGMSQTGIIIAFICGQMLFTPHLLGNDGYSPCRNLCHRQVMDALMLALLLCLFVESGGKMSILYRALHHLYDTPPNRQGMAISLGMIIAVAAHAAIAACAGYFIAQMLTPEARWLFLALALASSGASLLWSKKSPFLPEKRRASPLFSSALILFLRGLGENGPFLIIGVATATAWPAFAGIGGAMGSIAACFLMRGVGPALSPQTTRIIRAIIGCGLLVAALFISAQAMGLNG
ncbi:MAG: hypothetical protein E2598_09500 [Sphingobium sp.]|nr:hypothetical protein [Sphingobium sp.]